MHDHAKKLIPSYTPPARSLRISRASPSPPPESFTFTYINVIIIIIMYNYVLLHYYYQAYAPALDSLPPLPRAARTAAALSISD